MRQKSGPEKQPAEDAIRDIRRATCRHISAEEKIRDPFAMGGRRRAWRRVAAHSTISAGAERWNCCWPQTTSKASSPSSTAM